MSSPLPPYSYRESIKSDASDEPINVHLQRPLAGLLTRAVYSTPVTPNQLSIAGILFGVVGGVFLALRDTNLPAAALCFYLKDIFDSADGQLARAKQLFSRRGRFLDSIGDFVVDIFLFGGILIFLYRGGVSLGVSLLVSVAGFLGVSLRVSYHVFYQTSFLHHTKQYQSNRLTEELRDEDYQQDVTTVRLQRIFLLLYGWQDRLMVRIDAWCLGKDSSGGLPIPEWYQDAIGLRLGGLLGFGTEFVVLTACLLLGSVPAYLFFTIILFNIVWLVAIVYRKFILGRRISLKRSAGG